MVQPGAAQCGPEWHIVAQCDPEGHRAARSSTLGHFAAQNGTFQHTTTHKDEQEGAVLLQCPPPL